MNRVLLGGVVVLAMVAIAGCEQTRPVPEYKPLLALQATQPQSQQSVNPGLYATPKMPPKPGARKGGG